MSQFVAVVEWDRGAEGAADAEVIRRALGRWPSDSTRIEEVRGATLAQATLAIDVWRGADRLPSVDATLQIGVAADCRLDNRPELRRELSVPDTAPDSALLLQAYQTWGPETAAHLAGDFACVFWDWRRQEVVAL